MTDKRRAPESVMAALCEALVDWASPGFFAVSESTDPIAEGHNRVAKALVAYRAATAPLRTRQEVDADLAQACRAAVESNQLCGALFKQYVGQLCSEPTADEPEAKREPIRTIYTCPNCTCPKCAQHRYMESIRGGAR